MCMITLLDYIVRFLIQSVLYGLWYLLRFAIPLLFFTHVTLGDQMYSIVYGDVLKGWKLLQLHVMECLIIAHS